MDYYDALKHAAAAAGKTLADVSRGAGHGRQYVNQAITRGSDPATKNAAALLKTCGWSLVACPSQDVPPSGLVID